MSKIIFFAHDPGGANALAPLIAPLSVEHAVFVFAGGPALSMLPGAEELPKNALKTIRPDFLITGTSGNDKTEKQLWPEARSLNIKSMAILDHWVNYGIRFSKWGLREIGEYGTIGKPDIFPDYISVMDEFAKGEMIKEGIPEKIIFPLGNPHFEAILNRENTSRKKTGQKYVITFASEPYSEDYGRGYEKEVLRDLIEFSKDKDIELIVKLHPKENISKYKEFADEATLDTTTPARDIILRSDLVVSMTSMFLIEAYILNRRILSYQPHEQDSSKFILTRNKTLPFLNNKQDFFEHLDSKQPLSRHWDISFDGIKNNIKFINEVL